MKPRTHAQNRFLRRLSNKTNANGDKGTPIPGIWTPSEIAKKQRRRARRVEALKRQKQQAEAQTKNTEGAIQTAKKMLRTALIEDERREVQSAMDINKKSLAVWNSTLRTINEKLERLCA